MNTDIQSIGRKCEQCQADEWCIIDSDDYYHEICTKCGNMIEIAKYDYMKDFVCDECNCFSGSFEENSKFLAIRCKNCGKQHIMLTKHQAEDRRTPGAIPRSREVVRQEFLKKQQEEANKPKCPRCGCTDIQVVNKKWSLFGGFATNAVDRVCTKCKWKW